MLYAAVNSPLQVIGFMIFNLSQAGLSFISPTTITAKLGKRCFPFICGEQSQSTEGYFNLSPVRLFKPSVKSDWNSGDCNFIVNRCRFRRHNLLQLQFRTCLCQENRRLCIWRQSPTTHLQGKHTGTPIKLQNEGKQILSDRSTSKILSGLRTWK